MSNFGTHSGENIEINQLRTVFKILEKLLLTFGLVQVKSK